ncbi:MAG: hypothetical protein NZ914_15055 [Gemmatales bacterium]|nr:hypothetical protein [Gemmatales bacterium]
MGFGVYLELDGNHHLVARYLYGDEFDQVLARVVYTSPLSSGEASAPYVVQWYLTDQLNFRRRTRITVPH